MGAELHVVDAFTDQPFAGNPAAVVLLPAPRSDTWMQAVAAELGYSDTAFTVRDGGGEPRSLRWFTPVTEVDLCGHATLATAHVLGGHQRFSTRSGELVCTVRPNAWVEMDFPADPPTAIEPDDALANAMARLAVVHVVRGVSDVVVEVETAAQVRSFIPDPEAIAAIAARGLIVTAPGDRDGIDFVSRCFYPSIGIDEDPVTGSAHTTLASWWSQRRGRNELVGEQSSARGGIVRVAVRADRVVLSGRAVTVLTGSLHI
jgi:predicted PhzF superfamily epimerase YddE/YHI9